MKPLVKQVMSPMKRPISVPVVFVLGQCQCVYIHMTEVQLMCFSQFKLDFYCMCSLQKSSSNWEVNARALIHPQWAPSTIKIISCLAYWFAHWKRWSQINVISNSANWSQGVPATQEFEDILSMWHPQIIPPHTVCIWFWMAKDMGVASDGNFSSYLISRSWYNHFRSFSMGGNGGLH